MATQPNAGPRPRSAFFFIMAGLLGLVLFIGFSRSFFLKPLFDTPRLTIALVIHGLCGTSWFVMLARQAWLARSGRIADHRQLGSYAPYFALAIIISTIWVIVESLSVPVTGSGLPRSTGLLIQLSTTIWFVGLFVYGWSNRAKPEIHKRAMMLATIAMMAPAFSRISRLFRDGGPPLFDSAYLATFFIAALAVNDYRTKGRVHPVTGWVGLAYLAWVTVRMPIGRSDAWINLVQPLIGS